jgi:transcriptional regulator with XRE-family HTH domain
VDDQSYAEAGEDSATARRRRSTADRPTPDRRGTIPQRLNYLFETVRLPGSQPFSAAEVKRWIEDNGGQISSVYILKILRGERTDPSPKYLTSLARYFGVSPNFFWDAEPREIDGPALAAAIIMRNENVQSMLVRASQLSPRSQQALSDIIDGLLKAEGKDV